MTGAPRAPDWSWVERCRLLGGHPTLELFEEIVWSGESALPLLVEVLSRRSFREGRPPDCALLPVHAMRLLAEIGSPAAVPALVGVLTDPVDPGLHGEEAALALGRLGEPALGPLTRVAADRGRSTWVRSSAVQGLVHAALRDRRLRPRVIEALRGRLEDAAERDRTFVAQVVDACCRLAAEGLWPAIAAAHAAGRVDEDVIGIDAVELDLAVRRHRADPETKRQARRDVREDYATWDEAVDGLTPDERASLKRRLDRLVEQGAEPPDDEEDDP